MLYHLKIRLQGVQPVSQPDTNWFAQPHKALRLKFAFNKKRNCTTHEAKTQALVSSAVPAQLICVFVLHIISKTSFLSVACFYVNDMFSSNISAT